ncbi:MAG: hypothetical protein KBB16_03235, partial [Candidatus Pacebacteria bacterium]|nr:hypothetical protein [Candidatus Paceibacterota bacterium]
PYGFVEFYCTEPVANTGDCVIVPYTIDPAICTENCFSNVLFLPGLEASRLYDTREDGSEDQLWEPNSNSDVEDLYLDTNGESINTDIYTRDIIKSGQGVQKIYKSFSDMLDQLKSENKIKDWKAFAYDWRQDINDIVNNGTKYQDEVLSLIDTLQSLTGSTSNNGKVTIITHSNGGLLAKALLSKLQDDKDAGINNLIDSVDVLIMVGAPQIGTPAAVPAVIHGYDQDILGGLLMDKMHARELGRNMLGAYGLLPSREYINRVNTSPVTFVDNVIPSNITTAMVQTFGSAVDSYSEYKDFLFGVEGRINPPIAQTILPINLSQNLYSKSESLHDEIDNWVAPETLRVIQVAGWGVSTIASFEYYPKCGSVVLQNLICELDERPRFTLDGDKTVVTSSAIYMEDVEDYWVNLKKYNEDFISIFNINHKNILELSPTLDFISNVMNGSNSYNSNYITTEEPESDSNNLQLSIHSPATIDAYDSFGNHTGKVCIEGEDFCYVEEEIPNSTYLEFGEGKYLNLPEDNFSRIEIKGTGTGTFTYESEKVYPGETSTITAFKDIPVDANTLAEVTMNSDESLTLVLDQDGDGTIDKTLESELGDTTIYETIPPEISISFSTLKKEVVLSGVDSSPVNIIHSKVSTKAIDKQGNTSVLYYNKYKEGHDKLRLFFNKIVRNGVNTTLPNTFIEYSWKVNKKGTLTDLDTKVIIKGEEVYFFNYRKSINTTTIFKKEGKRFNVVTKRGFVPVSIITEGNSIKVSY